MKKDSHPLQNNTADLLRAVYSNYFLLKEIHQQLWGEIEIGGELHLGGGVQFSCCTGKSNVLSSLQVASSDRILVWEGIQGDEGVYCRG